MSQQHMIAGHVGGEVQVREVQVKDETRKVASFSVAVNNRFNREAPPTWYRISVWNGLANVAAEYVHKGDYVVISGSRLTASTWTDRDGNPRSTLELTAENVDFSGNKRGEGEQDNFAPPPSNPDDIPF